MKTQIFITAAALLLSLVIMNSYSVIAQKIFLNTYWQVEEIRGSDTYYIRWEVKAEADSLQFIYYCGNDTTYSDIKKSSNNKFSDTYKSQCNQKTKVVIDPFIKDEQYVEYIDIPFIKSLPDSL